jgi:Sulfotransferase family
MAIVKPFPFHDPQVIFVMGAAHSGTTILYKMIALHPDVTWFSQFSKRDGSIPGRFRLPGYRLLDHVLRHCFRHSWHKEEGPLSKFVVPRPGEANSLWQHLLIHRQAPAIQHLKSREVIKEQCRIQGKAVIVAKFLQFTDHIEDLRRSFPSALFINIVRDGRAVALSRYQKFRRSHDDNMAAAMAAQYWVDSLYNVDVQRNTINLLEFRYEDFCQDVHAWLRRIFAHANLNPQPYPFTQVPCQLQSTSAQRINELPPAILTRVQRIAGPMLERFGYVRQADGGGVGCDDAACSSLE